MIKGSVDSIESMGLVDGPGIRAVIFLTGCKKTECEKNGHNFNEATCEKAKECSVCSQTEGNPLGHTVVTDNKIEATCTTNGLTEGSHCSVCKEVLVPQTVVNALGHTEVIDEEDNRDNKFYYERGIEEFVEDLNEDKTPLHKVYSFIGEKDKIEVEVAMQYTESYNENIVSFVNNVKTIDGGSHEVGFKTALTKVFNDYAKSNGFST